MSNKNLTEEMNKIIDQYLLAFLDDFEEAFGRLPDEIEKSLWMAGFVDGMYAVQKALGMRKLDY